jgi:hypothetical protein
MRVFVLAGALALGLGLAGAADAALVQVTGGKSYTLPGGSGSAAYNNLSSPAVADPWTGGTEVRVGAKLAFASEATHVILTYVGKEAGYNNTLSSKGNVLFQNASTAPGTSVKLTIAEFASALFKSNGTGGGFGLSNKSVAVTFAGDVLQLGFNDRFKGDRDFDDMRVQAQVVPVPAALPLLATAMAGLWGVRRYRRAA